MAIRDKNLQALRGALFPAFAVAAFYGAGFSVGKVYLFHLLLPILLIPILFSVSKPKLKEYIDYAGKHHPWGWLLLLSLTSYFWSRAQTHEYLLYNGYLILGLLTVFIVQTQTTSLKTFLKVNKVLRYAYIFHLFIAILEANTSFHWPVSPYSPYCEFFQKSNCVKNITEYMNTYPSSFFWNPNNSALFTMTFLPLMWRQRFKIHIIFTLLAGLIIFQSASRAILVVFILYMLYLFLFEYKKSASRVFTLIGALSLILGFLMTDQEKLAEQMTALRSVGEYVQGTLYTLVGQSEAYYSQAKLINVSERVAFLEKSLELLKESWGLGVGAAGHHDIQLGKPFTGKTLRSPHNFHLEIILCFGLLGAFIYLRSIGHLIKSLFINAKTSEEPKIKEFSTTYLLCFCIFLIGCLVISSAIYFLPMYLLYGLICSLINISRSKTAT